MALENHSYEMAFFVDRQTGEVFPVFDDNDQSDADRARIDADPGRFVAVDPIPSSVGSEVMAAFVESRPTGAQRDNLAASLSARHPFCALKDGLSAYPHLGEEWYAFRYREWTRLAPECFEDESIEATLTVRRDASASDGGSRR